MARRKSGSYSRGLGFGGLGNFVGKAALGAAGAMLGSRVMPGAIGTYGGGYLAGGLPGVIGAFLVSGGFNGGTQGGAVFNL